MFRCLVCFCIASLLWLITGCYDEPDPVGAPVLPQMDFSPIQVDTFYATAHSSNYNLLYTQGIDRVMLGKFKTYEAWTCLKFNQWPDSMLGKTITGATIQFKTMYHFGDSSAAFSFDVYRLRASWDSLTCDLLKNNILQNNNNTYYDNNHITVQIPFIPPGDSQLVTISILDTTMLREWFSSNTDTTHLNEGVLLRPTNSNVIKGFYSCNVSDTANQPSLHVYYANATDPYIHRTGSSKYISHVDSLTLKADNNLVYVQNGIGYVGVISFDSISTPWPVLSFSAVLQVTLDPTTSSSQYNPFTYNTLYTLTVGSDGTSYGYYPIASSELFTDSAGQHIYQFNMLPIVSSWLNNSIPRRVALSGYYNESLSFDLFTFYGSQVNKKLLKPRLIIRYSLK